MIEPGAFKREFENGVVVNNSGSKIITIEFTKKIKRVSDTTIAISFKIDADDGDFFIAVGGVSPQWGLENQVSAYFTATL